MDKGLRKATKQKYQQLVGRLTENTLRLWAAVGAMSLGRGGITLLAGATGLSCTTIHAVSKNSNSPWAKSALGWAPRVSGPPARSQALTEQQPELLAEVERLVDPLTRGEETEDPSDESA